MAMMKKPMAKKMAGSMMRTGGKMMKAQNGKKTPMQEYKSMYPDADTSAKGDTRFGDEINAYAPKKVLDRVAAGDKAFNAKYGKNKPAVDKAKPAKAKPTKIKAKTGAKMKTSMMKKGGKMSKKKAC